MIIIMGFNTTSHGKFHDRRYPDILYRINTVDINGCCTVEHLVATITCLLSMFYYHVSWYSERVCCLVEQCRTQDQ